MSKPKIDHRAWLNPRQQAKWDAIEAKRAVLMPQLRGLSAQRNVLVIMANQRHRAQTDPEFLANRKLQQRRYFAEHREQNKERARQWRAKQKAARLVAACAS